MSVLPVATRRALLVEKRDRYLAMSLDAEAEAIALKVQIEGVSLEEQARAVRMFEQKAANCARSASEIDKMLAALPEE